MAETITFTTQPRPQFGTSTARKLRRQGRVPAVLYGHKQATVSLSLVGEDFEKALRQGARLVELKLDGTTEAALIQDIQWDHLGKEVEHIDFKRVSKDERVVVNVRLELRGQSPGVVAGGVLDQPIHSLSVEALVVALPDSIRVNIGELQIGSVVHLRDIQLPPGVKLMMTDLEAVVVQVKAPEVEEAAVAAPEAAPGAAEPEVITRRAADEKEAEEKK